MTFFKFQLTGHIQEPYLCLTAGQGGVHFSEVGQLKFRLITTDSQFVSFVLNFVSKCDFANDFSSSEYVHADLVMT